MSSFHTISRDAAQCERNGYLVDAARLWLEAAEFASKKINQEWCAIRADNCQTLRLRRQAIVKDRQADNARKARLNAVRCAGGAA